MVRCDLFSALKPKTNIPYGESKFHGEDFFLFPKQLFPGRFDFDSLEIA